MRGRIKKVIYILIVLTIGLYAYFNYQNKKYDSIKILGNGDNKYFALSVKDNRQESLRNFLFTTYDKETKEKEKYKFDENNSYIVNIPILIDSTKACGNWLLLKTADCNKLLGINADTGEIKVLVEVEEEKGQYIINFDLHGDNLVYSYNEDNLVKVMLKSISNDKSQYVGDFFSKNDIPLSIYEDKVALLKNNELYIYDCIDNNFTVIKGAKYDASLLIIKDYIYTFRKNDNKEHYFDLVKIDLKNQSEKTILKSVSGVDELELDGERVFFNQYFYDVSKEKLYYKESEFNNSYPEGRLILGDYIKCKNNKYEKIEYNKNCCEYTLETDRNSSYRLGYEKGYVEVLTNGQVLVTESKTNKIEKSFKGFNIDNRFVSWKFILDNNKLYGADISESGKTELVYINLEDGSKNIIKELDEDIISIFDLGVYDNEIMYSSMKDDKEIIKIINIDNKNETEYSLNKKDYIHDMFFNKGYLAYMIGGNEPIVVIYNREINEIKTSETENVSEEYYNVLGINDDGVMLESTDNNCKFVDFDFNIKKEFNNKDKAIKYIKSK